MTTETNGTVKRASLPPRWFIRAAWVVHRGIFRLTGGRLGLRPAKPGTWGMMRLHTLGRRSGKDVDVQRDTVLRRTMVCRRGSSGTCVAATATATSCWSRSRGRLHRWRTRRR